MEIIADLHLHSKYSRTVSQNMDLNEISRQSHTKGINLVATGDWTHPLWFREIKENLIEKTPGIYTLKNRPGETHFFLSVEISNIYSQGEQTRRVHNLIFSPSIETCEKINKELFRQGCKLMSDGRPIIGLSSNDLLELVLSIDKRVLFIPAHIWTPWFAVFGSKSGFDSLRDCFGNNEKYIYAIETGLSSDPTMNWQIKELETRSIVSFSDAHSGPKIGREATVFIENGSSKSKFQISNFSYDDIASAIKQDPNGKLKIGYTIEFFPEEGKYHWSGHRDCKVAYHPFDIKKKGKICPICGRPLTIGVADRISDLSDRILEEKDLPHTINEVGLTFVHDPEKKRPPFVSAIPFLEVLTELNDDSLTKAQREYERLTAEKKELDILLKLSHDELSRLGGKRLAEAIAIVRSRKAAITPGYDGIFGKVKVFDQDHEKEKFVDQQSLF